MLLFTLSIVVAYGLALLAWPVLRARSRIARGVWVVITIATLFCPLLIPAERVMLRALAAFLCVDLFFKMLDYSRQQRRRESDAAEMGRYGRLLIPFPALLVVFGERERRLPTRRRLGPDLLGAVVAAAVLASGFLLVDVAGQIAIVLSSFSLDHVVKLAIFIVTISALSRLLYHLERLAGFDTTPLVQGAFLSRTVAEFWWRYNTRVHLWFEQNVFLRCGGRRAPVRAVVACFFVSAVLHELMFAIATSRLDGYQFTFFMLQAPAVIASRPLQRLARRGGMVWNVAVRGVSILWMAATSVFFFHGVNRVFPFFYASESWLP